MLLLHFVFLPNKKRAVRDAALLDVAQHVLRDPDFVPLREIELKVEPLRRMEQGDGLSCDYVIQQLLHSEKGIFVRSFGNLNINFTHNFFSTTI